MAKSGRLELGDNFLRTI